MNYFYLLTAFICGAAIMIVEIVGTKILSPYFGSGLFIWSTSITVAMLALSIGYYMGGKQADKLAERLPKFLYLMLLLSAFIIGVTPLLSGIIKYINVLMDIKYSTLLSGMILLFPPLVFLGMVSPIVAKLIAKEIHKLGKDLGFIYALSTFGSLVGSLAAGFILLNYFAVDQIFFFTGALILLLSMAYFIYVKKYIYLILILPFVLMFPNSENFSYKSEELSVTKLKEKNSFYGKVAVVDLEKPQEKTKRFLLLDGIIQGGMEVESKKSISEYNYLIEEIINYHNQNKEYKNALFVGVGPGMMPTSLKNDFNIELVDVNPIVVDVAKEYFHLELDAKIEDARVFLNSSTNKRDVIVMDVFSGESIPSYLLTKEFMQVLIERINNEGIVLFNIIGNPYGGMESASIIKTIKSVFPFVNVVVGKSGDEKIINYIIVASKNNKEIDLKKLSINIENRLSFDKRLLATYHKNGIELIKDFSIYKNGDLITDNFNRIDFYSSTEKKDLRKKLSNFTYVVN